MDTEPCMVLMVCLTTSSPLHLILTEIITVLLYRMLHTARGDSDMAQSKNRGGSAGTERHHILMIIIQRAVQSRRINLLCSSQTDMFTDSSSYYLNRDKRHFRLLQTASAP